MTLSLSPPTSVGHRVRFMVIVCAVFLGITMYHLTSVKFLDIRPKREPDTWRNVVCGPSSGTWLPDYNKYITLQQLWRDVTPKEDDRNMFLIDVSCSDSPLYRVWCSVESWAHQNPNLTVWFVMTTLTADNEDGLLESLLDEYPNLHVVGTYLRDPFKGTPLQIFFEGKTWTRDWQWLKYHVSDMMRVAVVWHWGGIYADTDTICLRDMSHLNDSVAFQAVGSIANGFFKFKAHHHVLKLYMDMMMRRYKPGVWGSMGPQALTEVIRGVCEVKSLNDVYPNVPVTCKNVTLLSDREFFAIDWKRYKDFMTTGGGRHFNEKFNTSLFMHVWNKLSSGQAVRLESNSIYEVAAKKSCPITYHYATRRSLTF